MIVDFIRILVKSTKLFLDSIMCVMWNDLLFLISKLEQKVAVEHLKAKTFARIPEFYELGQYGSRFDLLHGSF